VVESGGLKSDLEEGKFYRPTDLVRVLSTAPRIIGLRSNRIKYRKTSEKTKKRVSK